MRYWFWLIAVLLPALAACSNSNSDCKLRVNGICYDKQRESDPPLKARWQIFDADSGKPLEGVWVNFAWYGPPDSRGTKRCVGAELGRTDDDGIFEATAKNGSWRIGGYPPMLFKLNFQPLRFEFQGWQHELASAFVDVQHYEVDAYPAWFKRLQELGYTYIDKGGTTKRYEKKYSVALIADGMRSLPYAESGRKEFWVTRRSLPGYAAAPGIGYKCNESGAVNTGFEEKTLRQVEFERAMHAYTYLCDPQWDTIPADYTRTSSRIFVHQSLWLLNDEEHAFNRALKIIPDYLGGPYKALDSEDRALRPEERIALCDWLAPYTQAPTKSMEP
jgi:hypothetical protein